MVASNEGKAGEELADAQQGLAVTIQLRLTQRPTTRRFLQLDRPARWLLKRLVKVFARREIEMINETAAVLE